MEFILVGLLLILDVVWGAYSAMDIKKCRKGYTWEPHTMMFFLLNAIAVLSVGIALLITHK